MRSDEIDKIHVWGETNAFYLFFEPIKLGWGSEGCILLFDYNTNGAKSERDSFYFFTFYLKKKKKK